MNTKASRRLELYQPYTRNQRAEIFDITDATVRTGVFHPKGYDSISNFDPRQNI